MQESNMHHDTNSPTRDVVILGGGLAGLSLALQLRQASPRAHITVLEKRDHPVPEAAFKVGESTVEVAANYFGEVLGLKDHIRESQLPKLGLRFFFPAGDNSRIEDRLELGGKRYAPAPSYQLDRGRFENFLADRCLEQGIEFLDQARVQEIEMGEGRKPHRVTYERGGETRQVTGRWVVDASGRRAFLKRQLDLQKESPHDANAAWFRFSKQIRIDDWSDSKDWQAGHEGKLGRWYSTNHFMGQGYWVWMIPLASGSTSVGIVAHNDYHPLSSINSLDKALAWLDRHEPQCAMAMRENLEHVQDFRAIRHYAVEAKQVFSGQRWGITGEAGFFHDPFYSPGSDFIAFSNTFLTDLIRRDLAGQGFRIRAFAYDRIFKRFYYGTATAYYDQYEVFGNPQVMPIKILWDYLIYWSITGFIFMHNRTCQQTMYLRQMKQLSKLGRLNHFMQEFFRRWHRERKPYEVHGTIDISQIPLIRQSNQRLLEPLSDREFRKQFAANVGQLETLFWEILDHAGLEVEVPFKRVRHSDSVPNAFADVFAESTGQVTSMSRPAAELVSAD